jgi:hypothetical protein
MGSVPSSLRFSTLVPGHVSRNGPRIRPYLPFVEEGSGEACWDANSYSDFEGGRFSFRRRGFLGARWVVWTWGCRGFSFW